MTVDTALLRILIGDVDGVLVDDDIVTSIANAHDNTYLAAAAVADHLAAKFSTSVTFSVEGLSIQSSVKAENFRTLADRLRAQAATTSGGAGAVGGPSVTGISIGTMDGVESNPDRVRSRVKVGQDDNPGTRGGVDWIN